MTIQRVGAPIAGGGNQPNDVAVLTDGSFYVAQSANSLQHYGPDGSLIGGPVVIDYPVGPQGVYFADLVPLTGGGFAVMFINGNINAGNFDGASVRYFAADGTPSSPFITVAEPNGIRKDEFNIVAKSDGGVFVSWSDNTNSGELYNPLFAGTLDYGGGTGAGRGTDLAGRSISALGVAGPIDLADGTELATNSNHSYNGLAGDQRPGANAAFSDGTVLAPYVEINFKAVPGNIDQPNSVANEPIPSVSYRVFGAEGFSVEGRIDAGTVSFLQRPDSVVLANGNFAIVYTEDNASSGGPRYSTQVGIVNGIDGSLLSDTVLLERASSSGLNDTRIVALSDGGFAMAYVTADAGSGGDVGLLIVNADGTVRDNSLIASGPGTQNLTDFNTSPDGTLYVSYFDSSATVGAQYATQRFVITGSGGVVKTGSDDRNDVLVGTEGQDRLSGLGGNDKLLGLGGDDQLYGGAGNDKLDGGAGADLMVGGSGNDTYTVDSLGDTIDERGDATGIDQVNSSVSFTLGTNLEKLTLTGAAAIDGSGNELANRIVGNGAANLLHGGDGNDTLAGGAGNDTLYGDAGNDKLDGGAGADAMHGGAGNDTYLVDNVGDTVDETGVGGGDAGGTDKVTLDTYAYVLSGGSSYALSAYVENLSLTGTAALDATGNDLANRITGNAGANSLVGGAGNDTLNGLAGRDILTGGDGKDTLTGGTGADTFVFGPANAASADKVTDFSSFDGDRLQFRAEDFGLSPGKGVAADGTLATDYFEVVSGKTAVGTRDHGEFLFNTSTKLLSWDADGSGKGAAIAVATFTVPAGTAIADFLKASDFHLV